MKKLSNYISENIDTTAPVKFIEHFNRINKNVMDKLKQEGFTMKMVQEEGKITFSFVKDN